MTEDEMVGWHHQLSRHEFDQARGDGKGQGSLAYCSPILRGPPPPSLHPEGSFPPSTCPEGSSLPSPPPKGSFLPSPHPEGSPRPHPIPKGPPHHDPILKGPPHPHSILRGPPHPHSILRHILLCNQTQGKARSPTQLPNILIPPPTKCPFPKKYQKSNSFINIEENLIYFVKVTL